MVRTLAAANASACLQLEPDYGFGGLANTVGMMNAVLAYALESAPELSFRFSPLLAPSAQHRGSSWRNLFFQPANDLTGRSCRRDGGDGPRLGATTCLRCPAELPCEAATLVEPRCCCTARAASTRVRRRATCLRSTTLP